MEINENATTWLTPHFKKLMTKKNEILFNEGAICDRIGYIAQGNIRIVTYPYTEQEYTITTLSTYDFFGDTLIFSNEPIYLGNVICSSDCELWFIQKQDFLDLLQTNASFLNTYLQYAANKHFILQQKIKVLLQKEIKDKILFYIEEQTKYQRDKRIKITSKEALAVYLNVTRPSLSRTLMHLKKDNLIDYNRQFIWLK